MIRDYKKGSKLLVFIGPNAMKDEIIGTYGNPVRLKIKIKAPAVDGKANKALISLLGKTFKLKTTQIEILSGETTRQKEVYLQLEAQEIIKILDNNCGISFN